jgi:hypothetical protein
VTDFPRLPGATAKIYLTSQRTPLEGRASVPARPNISSDPAKSGLARTLALPFLLSAFSFLLFPSVLRPRSASCFLLSAFPLSVVRSQWSVGGTSSASPTLNQPATTLAPLKSAAGAAHSETWPKLAGAWVLAPASWSAEPRFRFRVGERIHSSSSPQAGLTSGYRAESAAGAAHSKTSRNFAAAEQSRQRLGVRDPCPAFPSAVSGPQSVVSGQ